MVLRYQLRQVLKYFFLEPSTCCIAHVLGLERESDAEITGSTLQRVFRKDLNPLGLKVCVRACVCVCVFVLFMVVCVCVRVRAG